MPVGGEFLEVVAPFRDDASGARYLARRGGDAGYMVILQDADAMAHRARLEAMGVRLIAKSRGDDYQYTHFHPADCAGVLMSLDSVPGDASWREPKSDWPPAGPKWRDHQSEAALGITGVSTAPIDFGVPKINFTNFTGTNDPVPSLSRSQTFRYTDTFSFLLPKHTVRTGF